MKVLEEGHMHKAMQWTDTCEVCGSRVRFFEDRGDPLVYGEIDYGYYAKAWKYSCPVCKHVQVACVPYRDKTINMDSAQKRYELCKTKREEVTLTLEDLEEIKGYSKEE